MTPSPRATSTALVVHPATGEALDLLEAPTEQLAKAVDEVADLRGRLNDFAGAVDAELLARLDRRASWTLRIDGYEIKAPSPDAGTETYDPAILEAEIATLVGQRTIDAEGAEAALERTVTVTVRVPFGHDIDDLALKLGDVDAIAGVPCAATSVQAGRKVSLRGVKALGKVPGAGEALARARVNVEPPARRVKVKPLRKERP